MSLPTSQLWVNGLPRSTDRLYDVINPGSQTVVGHAACASSADAIDAILAAEVAQPAWEAVPARAKRAVLLRVAELIQSPAYANRFVEAVQHETGALLDWAQAEVQGAANVFLDAACTALEVMGETMPSVVTGGTVIVERRPIGVVFAVAPFNAPVVLAARAVTVPIACGNTAVLKSSENSPLCSTILVEAMHEAGLPKGVLNLLHMAKEESPKIIPEIIGHKAIRHINFTGSDRVGQILAGEAAKHLKPCLLELGGKAAAVVLDDANVEDAARSIIFGAMYNSGQMCMSTERVIVQRSISEQLIRALTSLAEKIHAGTSPTSQIGAVITPASAARILSLITDARSRGAHVLVGDLSHTGAVIQPHIVLNAEPGWPLWERESFGPVFVIKVAETEDEAVALANCTEYTLMSAVWTKDVFRGLTVARRIRAGQVLINGPTFAHEPGLGVHGLGGSTGYGEFNIENFTQRRTLVIAPPSLQLPLVNDL